VYQALIPALIISLLDVKSDMSNINRWVQKLPADTYAYYFPDSNESPLAGYERLVLCRYGRTGIQYGRQVTLHTGST
jgi:hypothetical protein